MSNKIGLKGMSNEPEIRQYIREFIGTTGAGAASIMTACKRRFGTTDNQIRSLLVYMLRDGSVVLDDAGVYRVWNHQVRVVNKSEPIRIPVQQEEPDWLAKFYNLPDGWWYDSEGNLRDRDGNLVDWNEKPDKNDDDFWSDIGHDGGW